jgi:hypothetical protein
MQVFQVPFSALGWLVTPWRRGRCLERPIDLLLNRQTRLNKEIATMPATALDLTNPVWQDLLLENASKPQRLVPGCATRPNVPAPRLVGVELNPGPDPNSPVKGLVAAVTKLLTPPQSRKAKTKKKKTNVKKNRGGSTMALTRNSSLQYAPVASAQSTSSLATTNSFAVPFSTTLVQVVSQASLCRLLAVEASPTSVDARAVISISPYQTTSVAGIPQSFAAPVNRLAYTFAQYRIRPGSMRITYMPAVSTGTNGQIAIAALPAEEPSVVAQYFNDVANSECAITVPTWGTAALDSGRLRSILCTNNDDGWKYCDFDGTVTGPEFRQSVMLNLAVSGIGLPAGAGTTLGTLFATGVLEFRHIQNTATVTPPGGNATPAGTMNEVPHAIATVPSATTPQSSTWYRVA